MRDKTRKPGKTPLSVETIAKVLALPCGEPPGEATHWTGRIVAKVEDVVGLYMNPLVQAVLRARAPAAAGHVMLVTSISQDEINAADLLALYRLRWQVELAFKRIKSLLGMRIVPTKDPDLARTWLCSNLLVALPAEGFGAEIAESFPCAV